MDHKDDINDTVTLIKYAVLAGIPLALILVEPNLSTTICTALVICLLIYVGGLSYKFIGTVLLILVPVAIIFLSIAVQPNQPFLKDYQQKRILAFLEPESMPVMKHISRITLRWQSDLVSLPEKV